MSRPRSKNPTPGGLRTRRYRDRMTVEQRRAHDLKYSLRRRAQPGYKARVRKYDLKKRYGLDPGQLIELYEHQEGKCAICKRELKLNVDHCHETGKVRGLLCYRCNTGLGAFGDNLAGIEAVVDYLKKAI